MSDRERLNTSQKQFLQIKTCHKKDSINFDLIHFVDAAVAVINLKEC